MRQKRNSMLSARLFSNVVKLVIESSLVIAFCFLVLFLDRLEFSGFYVKGLILFLVVIKVIYFISKGLKRIIYLSGSNLEYYEILFYLMIHIGIIIISFAIDYYCLYIVDPTSFSGVPSGLSTAALLFKFFYFSLLIYANIGIVKIIPESSIGEVILLLEAILSFGMIIFILSDFLSLRESLAKVSEKKED